MVDCMKSTGVGIIPMPDYPRRQVSIFSDQKNRLNI